MRDKINKIIVEHNKNHKKFIYEVLTYPKVQIDTLELVDFLRDIFKIEYMDLSLCGLHNDGSMKIFFTSEQKPIGFKWLDNQEKEIIPHPQTGNYKPKNLIDYNLRKCKFSY